MTDIKNNAWLKDGIPVLSDIIDEHDIPELFPAGTLALTDSQVESLSRTLQAVFEEHTDNVIRGVLDDSPEQQRETLFLKIRECLKQELPLLLQANTTEQNHDELDS